ncbi:hypothetical protein BGX27_002116, partial [Mortierella sp. AM989]
MDALRQHITRAHTGFRHQFACLEEECKVYLNKGELTKYNLQQHSKYICSTTSCRKEFSDLVALEGHISSHRIYKCSFPGCSGSYNWEQSLRKHMKQKHGDKRDHTSEVIQVPPPSPIPGYTGAFKVTVRHNESLVDRIPAQLHEENLLFPVGSSVDGNFVKVAGKVAMPLAWLDNFSKLTKSQENNYERILKAEYIIASPLRPGKVCIGNECDISITWRNVGLHAKTGHLYFVGNSGLCNRCANKAQVGKVTMLRAPGRIVPACVEHNRCAKCLVKLDRTNSSLRAGSSTAVPLRFQEFCHACNRDRAMEASTGPMYNMSLWVKSPRRIEQFGSREIALSTVMTVAIQGFAFGSAMYQPSEEVFLRSRVEQSNPQCFWTGVDLSLGRPEDPRKKFSVDRTAFLDGKALPYSAEDQVLVASSDFCN